MKDDYVDNVNEADIANDPYLSLDDWSPSVEEYTPGFSKEQWLDLLKNESIIGPVWGGALAAFYSFGGAATCSQVAAKYHRKAFGVSGNCTQLAMSIYKKTNCQLSIRENGNKRYWPILFQGKNAGPDIPGTYIWRLRPELYEALTDFDIMRYEWDEWDPYSGNLDDLGEITEEEALHMNETISKNTILYGPPGTGKTYNTIFYSVAIIEGKTVDVIKQEGIDAVKKRYDKYSEDGHIAFTTFHQSYGYEEFIEGIKPSVDEENNITYSVKDGMFKQFCEKASAPSSLSLSKYGVNSDPAIWKVSLGGSHENSIRTECLENDHIRIGWDEYGSDISERIDELTRGKLVLNAFYNIMKIGDIVVSCYSAKEIDAIGVITGEPEWDDRYRTMKRVRKVNWIVKNIRENILDYQDYPMAPATIYWIGLHLNDVITMLEKNNVKELPKNNEKYVFVIDEINRGNISKVFGELITLIEDTKRIGTDECMKVRLPYSNTLFGVPDNVYIIGTMNTADRSIAIMDTALRRRFEFVEMLPDISALEGVFINDNNTKLNVAEMLRIINERIEFLYDREHTIGHAFFIPLKKKPTLEMLSTIFRKRIIPLLQEYFYEDYEKIQMVLGDYGITDKQYQFVRDEDAPKDLFGKTPDIEFTKKYTIQKSAFGKLESYTKITK